MAPIEIRRSRVVTTGKGFLADVGMVAGIGAAGSGAITSMGSGTEFGVSSIIGGVERSGATSSVSFTGEVSTVVLEGGVGKEPVWSLGIS